MIILYKKTDFRQRIFSILCHLKNSEIGKYILQEDEQIMIEQNVMKLLYQSEISQEVFIQHLSMENVKKMALRIVLMPVNENNLMLLNYLFIIIWKKFVFNIINVRRHQGIMKNQLEQIAKKYRKMRGEIATSNTFIIVDDEKYVTFSNGEMS